MQKTSVIGARRRIARFDAAVYPSPSHVSGFFQRIGDFGLYCVRMAVFALTDFADV